MFSDRTETGTGTEFSTTEKSPQECSVAKLGSTQMTENALNSVFAPVSDSVVVCYRAGQR